MRFEKKIYRNEVSKKDNILELKELRIQRYIISKFGINEEMSLKVLKVLDRMSFLTYDDISSGKFDLTINLIINEFTSKNDDAKVIRTMEKDEHVVKVSNNKESHNDNEEKGQLMDARIAEANEKKKAIDKQIEEMMAVMNDNVDSIIHRR